jgi:hypothetical protein
MKQHETCSPGRPVRGSATLRSRGLRPNMSGVLVNYRRSFSLQEFYNFLRIFGFHSDFYQGCVKMLQEEIKVRLVQTMISGSSMHFMKIFPGIHTPAQDHGNEHDLPRPQVRHVYSFKKMAQFLILRNFLVEQFRCSNNRFTSPDQLIKIFGHNLLDK